MAEPEGSPADREFWSRYAPIARGNAGRPFVLGQLGQSLDGRIATSTGCSHYINGPDSLRHLHRLRALVDAVVVGVDTAIADNPRLTVRMAEGRNPVRVVIDPNGRLADDAKMFANDGVRRFALQNDTSRKRPAGVEMILLPVKDGQIAPADIVAALAERGFKRLLIEGGARTLSAFLTAGAMDRLHICVAPIMIGSGPIGMTLPPIDGLEHAVRPQTAIHRLGDDILFDCAFERRS